MKCGIKEGINLLAEDIDDVIDTSLKMNNCSLAECFPAYANKRININGKEYMMSVEVKLKEFNN